MKHLIVYPNASMGGVASVIRGRATAEPQSIFHVVYFYDRGGLAAFADLDNVHVMLSPHGRGINFLSYLLSFMQYDAISFLSCPDVLAKVELPPSTLVSYEIHSSDMGVISRELRQLPKERVAELVVPSAAMGRALAMSEQVGDIPIRVCPNLVDHGRFFKERPVAEEGKLSLPPRSLVWVGRFDKGKAYRSFLRLLGLLPEEWSGIVVVSLESDPARAGEWLGEAATQRVSNRLVLLQNMSQVFMGELYRHAADTDGWLVSTSLLESFGYSVAEALSCGLRVAAFDLPALREQPDPAGLLHLVDIGNVTQMAKLIGESA